jgi:nickel-type superoxide dismutase maturation protease
MAPGLRSGDRLLVRLGARARVGDVVVAGRPDRPELLLLKRVVRIERDRLWLHGDNPEASDDSRLFGAVETWDVFGRVVLRYWPVRRRAS